MTSVESWIYMYSVYIERRQTETVYSSKMNSIRRIVCHFTSATSLPTWNQSYCYIALRPQLLQRLYFLDKKIKLTWQIATFYLLFSELYARLIAFLINHYLSLFTKKYNWEVWLCNSHLCLSMITGKNYNTLSTSVYVNELCCAWLWLVYSSATLVITFDLNLTFYMKVFLGFWNRLGLYTELLHVLIQFSKSL